MLCLWRVQPVHYTSASHPSLWLHRTSSSWKKYYSTTSIWVSNVWPSLTVLNKWWFRLLSRTYSWKPFKCRHSFEHLNAQKKKGGETLKKKKKKLAAHQTQISNFLHPIVWMKVCFYVCHKKVGLVWWSYVKLVTWSSSSNQLNRVCPCRIKNGERKSWCEQHVFLSD